MTNEEWPFKYFSKRELECKCGCGGLPSFKFIQTLEAMREVSGFPWLISSGYRCSKHNAEVSRTGENGPHTIDAVDVLVWGEKAFKVVSLAFIYGITGIGVNQKGPKERRFIHLDPLKPDGIHPRPYIWSY